MEAHNVFFFFNPMSEFMSDIMEEEIPSFNNISIQGRKLFSTEEEMNAHIPPHIMPRFLEVINTISSLEMFNYNTRLDYLLKLDFSGELTPEKKSNISRFLTAVSAPDKCVSSQGSMSDFFAWDDLKEENIHEDLFLSLMNDLEQDVERLDSSDVKPLSHGSSHQEYKLLIRNVCKNIFIRHYVALQKHFDSELAPVSNSNLGTFTSQLCDHVELNSNRTLDYFNRDCAITDVDTYYKNVFDIVMDKRSREVAINKPFKKLFMVCFYPYFMFEFLMNNVATMEHDSMDSAPRFFFVQRITILGAYMFMFYTMITMIDKMGGTKLQNHYGKAFAIMSKINDNLFAQEKISKDHALGYNDLQAQTNATRSLALELQEANNNIIKIKNNLTKAALNNALLVPRVSSSRLYMYIWLTLFLVSVVSLGIMMFFSQVKVVGDIFYALSSLIVVAIAIAFAIRMYRMY